MGRYHHLALLFGTPYIRNDVRYMIVENECKVWKCDMLEQRSEAGEPYHDQAL